MPDVPVGYCTWGPLALMMSMKGLSKYLVQLDIFNSPLHTPTQCYQVFNVRRARGMWIRDNVNCRIKIGYFVKTTRLQFGFPKSFPVNPLHSLLFQVSGLNNTDHYYNNSNYTILQRIQYINTVHVPALHVNLSCCHMVLDCWAVPRMSEQGSLGIPAHQTWWKPLVCHLLMPREGKPAHHMNPRTKQWIDSIKTCTAKLGSIQMFQISNVLLVGWQVFECRMTVQK